MSIFKPPFGSRIDWSHPITKGLVCAYITNVHTGDILHNLINNKDKGLLTSGAVYNDNGISIPSYTGASIVNLPDDDDKFRFVFPEGTLICNASSQSTSGWPSLWIVRDASTTISSFNLDIANSGFSFQVNGAQYLNFYDIPDDFTNLHTYAASWGTRIKLYYDGTVVKNTATTNTPQSSNIIPSLGNRQSGGRGLNGELNFFYGFSRCLTDAEIKLLYDDPYCFIERDVLEWDDEFAAASDWACKLLDLSVAKLNDLTIADILS